ncbi:AAA family ATPase [Streptomyces goshikiensis]|uniref:AAA family ATPase n=1 Tax=Streptomyces goshikiensis TaxID=1942 RepID=UPI003687C01A
MRPWVVSWKNFRGFEEAADIEFPRLTILIGRNNVGKTSAYAPLLLLRQTLDARDPRTALLTRGDLIDAGSYKDLVTDHETDRTMVFSVGLDQEVPVRRSSQSKREPAQLELSFGLHGDEDIYLSKSRVLDRSGKALVTRSRAGSSSYSVSSPILPAAAGSGRPLREISQLRKALRDEQPENFLFNGMRALVIPRNWREDRERWNKAREWLAAVSELVDIYWDVNHELRGKLGSISYLGPLRSLPKRTYQVSAERPNEVGRDGEFAPELLLRNSSEEVRNLVDDWLLRLGYGKLDFEMRGDDFFQVYLCANGTSGLRVNLAHCGVGLSQLLPTLVQGATAPKGSTLISQQPEIHLNPAQQCHVTDFLIDTAIANRRVIVETHSEHILLRLRRRIAEGKIPSSDVAVYYCDARDGRSFIEKVPMGGKAELDRSDWPSGFFEEQLEDSMALAVAQMRQGG